MALACLEHLTKLTLGNLYFVLAEYADRPLPSFPRVQSLRLELASLVGMDQPGAEFCLHFSAMFPNLRQLHLQVFDFENADFEPHRGLFRHLQKHELSSVF